VLQRIPTCTLYYIGSHVDCWTCLVLTKCGRASQPAPPWTSSRCAKTWSTTSIYSFAGLDLVDNITRTKGTKEIKVANTIRIELWFADKSFDQRNSTVNQIFPSNS
jgi:hypothetical protein